MLNQVQIIGRLGNDPEIRSLASGDSVANVSVATTEKWKDRDGNQQEKTEWHRIVIWGKLAEIVSQYLHKGDMAFFQGKITTEKYQDKDGRDVYATKIVCNDMKMLQTKRDGDQGGQDRGASRPPASDGMSGRAARGNSSQGRQSTPQQTGFDDPDDIPF